MSRTLEIVTPEHVAIRYELAGFGSRGLAAVVDMGLQLLIYALLAGIIAALVYLELLPGYEDWTESVITGLAILAFFLVTWGYYIVFETLWNGETPGKRWLGLRVIKDGGYPVDFRAVLIRNLLRPADTLPAVPGMPSYAFAFIAMLNNPHLKRLGDMAAGTLVVRHGKEEDVPSLPGLGEAQVFRLLDAATLAQVARLDKEEYRMVKLFLSRRRELPAAQRGEFARRLAQPLIDKFNYRLPTLGMDYERWLDELDLAYRSRALGTLSQAVPAAAVVTAPSAPQTITPSAPTEAPMPPSEPLDGRKW